MRKMLPYFLMAPLLLLTSGCVTVESVGEPGITSTAVSAKTSVAPVHRLEAGMSRQEVLNIMPRKVKVGFRQDPQIPGLITPIHIENPQRVEVLKDKDRAYDILYYFTGVKKADGIIADDEMIPLVFEGDTFVGKGYDFLFELKDDIKS